MQKTITCCDMCEKEITSSSNNLAFSIKGNKIDLCEQCSGKVLQFIKDYKNKEEYTSNVIKENPVEYVEHLENKYKTATEHDVSFSEFTEYLGEVKAKYDKLNEGTNKPDNTGISKLDKYGVKKVAKEYLWDKKPAKYFMEKFDISLWTFNDFVRKYDITRKALKNRQKEKVKATTTSTKESIKPSKIETKPTKVETKPVKVEAKAETSTKKTANKGNILNIEYIKEHPRDLELVKSLEKPTFNCTKDCSRCIYKNRECNHCWYLMTTGHNNEMRNNCCKHFVDIDKYIEAKANTK